MSKHLRDVKRLILAEVKQLATYNSVAVSGTGGIRTWGCVTLGPVVTHFSVLPLPTFWGISTPLEGAFTVSVGVWFSSCRKCLSSTSSSHCTPDAGPAGQGSDASTADDCLVGAMPAATMWLCGHVEPCSTRLPGSLGRQGSATRGKSVVAAVATGGWGPPGAPGGQHLVCGRVALQKATVWPAV